MRRTDIRFAVLALCLLATVGSGTGGVPGLAQAGQLRLDPPASEVATGDNVNLTVRLDNATNVYGAAVGIGFDPAALAVVGDSVTPGTCPQPNFVVANGVNGNVVNYAATQLNPTPPCNGGPMATIEFRCNADLTTDTSAQVSIANSLISNPDGQAIAHSTQNALIHCRVGCTDDIDCDDGLYCNGSESCDAGTGACMAGTPPSCDDGVSCTEDSCDEGIDQCVNTPNDTLCADDGLFCNGIEVCDAVQDCVSTGDPCPGGLLCNETNDACEVPQPVLTVQKTGTGTGTVESNPPGIDCGSDCSEPYDTGALVSLSCVRDQGSTFEGWSGDCSDTWPDDQLIMDADKTCTADFASCVAVKDLSGGVVSDAQYFEACAALQAGNFLIKGTGGNATFVAGEQISLRSGFTVQNGAVFSVMIDPALSP